MNMRYTKKYLEMKFKDPLPPLPEDERIYLNVTYKTRDYAKYVHCGYDPEKKLWFTGSLNTYLESLVNFYGVHEATSTKARRLLEERLEADAKARQPY